MSDTPDFANWTCPLPLRTHPNIVMGHGGGGKLMADLIQHLFLPALGNSDLRELADAAVVDTPGARLALTTDSFVVRPLFFPGGNIGDLAVNGTVNDLAMRGARPRYLTAGFILEEGLPLAQLSAVVESMASAARIAGVTLVAGDTKVVDHGHGDGIYINTTGVGAVDPDLNIGPQAARPGDCILVNGPIGDHGMAIMSVREGLSFESTITSDCAPLADLVAKMLDTTRGIHVLRDLTRGGLASALNEIAQSAQLGMELDEAQIPVNGPVRAACEFLGLDPFYVANEGKFITILPEAEAARMLAVMRQHPLGRQAALIGRVTQSNPGRVVARTPFGATRLVDLQISEQLPRIC